MITYTKFTTVVKGKEKQFHGVDRVFWLAILERANGTAKSFYGINVGISLRHKNNLAWNSAYKSIVKHIINGSTIYLHGYDRDKKVVVPVVICGGNCWNEKAGTSCLFGYISPDILAGDKQPPYPQ